MDKSQIKKESAVFVIFGATGDLAKKRIFPALVELTKAKLLPTDLKIIACARSKLTKEEFKVQISNNLEIKNQDSWHDIATKIDYLSLDLAQDINLENLKSKIEEFENHSNTCPDRIYYMAISPAIFEKSIENFGKHKLHIGC